MVAGHELALHELGGSWGRRGTAPVGFAELDDALNYLARQCPGWAIDTPAASARLAIEGTLSFPIRFR